MKKVIYSLMLVLGMSAALSCEKFDDTDIWKEISALQSRVGKLEDMCKEMNTNISSLQTVVSALQNNDYITNVAPVVKAGETIGYTITFSKNGSITILNGENGKDGVNGQDGQDGKDGTTPVISVVLEEDGLYYWTVNGEYLLDANGNKITASGKDGIDGKDGQDGQNGKDGITPQLKIEDSEWYVSVDNGTTWKYLGSATSTSSSPIVSVDTSSDNSVSFVLNDGSSISIPRYEDISKLLIGTWKGEYEAYADYRFTSTDYITFNTDGTYHEEEIEISTTLGNRTRQWDGTYTCEGNAIILQVEGQEQIDVIISFSKDKIILDHYNWYWEDRFSITQYYRQ